MGLDGAAAATGDIDVLADTGLLPETLLLVSDGAVVAELPFHCAKNATAIVAAARMARSDPTIGDEWKGFRFEITGFSAQNVRDLAALMRHHDGRKDEMGARQPQRDDIPEAYRALLEPYERAKDMASVNSLVLTANKVGDDVVLRHACAFVATAIRGLLPQGVRAVLSGAMTRDEALKVHDGAVKALP